MDLHSLAAAHLPPTRSPAAMDARAEERYYRTHGMLPQPRLRLLISVATTAGVILLLLGAAQA